MDRLDPSLDRSVYYTIGDDPRIWSIPNAVEKNISNLFADIFDKIQEINDSSYEGMAVTFTEYLGEIGHLTIAEFDVLRPEDGAGERSCVRPISIAHARSIRFALIGKKEAPLRIAPFAIEANDEELPDVDDYDEEESVVEDYDEEPREVEALLL